MNYLHCLYILLFIINFPLLSIENPILNETITTELVDRGKYSTEDENSNVTPANHHIENSTELYNFEGLGSTEREEWNSTVTGNSSAFGSVFKENVSIDQEGVNFTTSEKLVSIIPEYQVTSILDEDWNSTTFQYPFSTNSMQEINIIKNDTSPLQIQDQKTEEPETESDDIENLLDHLINKLKVPSNNWLNYHYIMAMESPDGSIYIPKNHKQSTRKHLITLLGFAEEIVSNKNGITYVNNKSEDNQSITTQWINDDILVLGHNLSIIGDNQSNNDDGYINKLWNTNETFNERNITNNNNHEFSDIDHETGTFTEILDLSYSNVTELDGRRLTDHELHESNESNDLHTIVETIILDDMDHRVSEPTNQSSILDTEENLSNTPNELQVNSSQENITTDSMDTVHQQLTKLIHN
ncbi:unnamed protein product [Schistosoma rodhaini]|uniref:Sporozoite invasion-associated protein 2 n=1 Tax=Schistosoma rodhaini TaxID=6188 RepID=A0A183QCI1_9TREM|nr:unnamed protein product [Schistosoma rodhaini]